VKGKTTRDEAARRRPAAPAESAEGGGGERAPEGTPLYVHLPFCAAKCHYCDFYSIAAEGQDIDGTVDAVLLEAARRAPRSPRTVFFGGGTPSLLSIEQLTRLLDGLEEVTGFRSSSVETTLESNPESVDQDKAEALRELGVERLSIGFQSLEPSTLELFGRVHGVEDSFRAFEAARAGGFDEINVDLIYAAPGHDPERWAVDLPRVLALGPKHVSAYALAFEEETLFSKWLAEGKLQQQPEEQELALFHQTHRILAEHGFTSYEVSNFAPTGHECLHNLNYWGNGSYCGIGPSAVSHLGGRRAGNHKSLAPWRKAVQAGVSAEAWDERLEPRGRLGECWWLGLRLRAGVDPAELREVAGWTDPQDPALEVARPLLEEGLLEEADGRVRLTAAGLPLADAVSRSFLA
jgi:putative oxygen-independent coproporphyrinogen III oxidase